MQNSSQSHVSFRGYIPELEGIRGIGIMFVLFAHLGPEFPRDSIIWQIQAMTWVWVDFFFVLSGFLITGILLDTRERPTYYRDFYIRRSLRVFPVYYCLLLLGAVALLTWNGGAGYTQIVDQWGSPAWFLVYLGNLKTVFENHWPTVAFLVPLWSLQVEEQFYTLFPPVVRRVTREGLAKVLLAAIITAPLVRLALFFWDPANTYLQYVLLPCRWDSIAFGGAIALRCRSGPWAINRWWLVLGSLAVFAATYAFLQWAGSSWNAYRVRTLGYSVAALACSCLLLLLIVFRNSWHTTVLRRGPIHFFGSISYGIYIWHLPALALVIGSAQLLGWNLPINGWRAGSWEVFALLTATALAIATLSWYALEKPALALKERFAPTVAPGHRLPSKGPLALPGMVASANCTAASSPRGLAPMESEAS